MEPKEPNNPHRDLARSLEELMFGTHATRKNRLDINRFVTALLHAVRDEVASQMTPGESDE